MLRLLRREDGGHEVAKIINDCAAGRKWPDPRWLATCLLALKAALKSFYFFPRLWQGPKLRKAVIRRSRSSSKARR